MQVTPAWCIAYRQSVSWGDQIRWVPDHPCGVQAAFIEETGNWVIGTYSSGIIYGLVQCLRLGAATGAAVNLLVLDQQLSAMRVEQLVWAAARAGVGMGFLAAGPQVHRDRLMVIASEETIIDKVPFLP